MTTVERFRAYIDAFNRGDYAAFADRYTADIELTIASGRTIEGRGAVIDFYRQVNAATTRTIRVIKAFADEYGLAAELESEFLALADAPDFASRPLNRGDRLYIRSFALYDLSGERYRRIRAAALSREHRPADTG
jgi:hypothetical protein